MGLINREKEAALSHDFLRSIIAYCPETGIFKWREKRGVNGRSDRHAGYVMANGYRVIRVDYSKFLAHRLAWFYMHSEWPEEEIDHINRDRGDNRIVNLRLATRTLNSWNTAGFPRRSATGLKHIHAKGVEGFRVRVVRNGRVVVNKRATTLSKAVTIRDIALGALPSSNDSYLTLGG